MAVLDVSVHYAVRANGILASIARKIRFCLKTVQLCVDKSLNRQPASALPSEVPYTNYFEVYMMYVSLYPGAYTYTPSS